jgi:5-methylcytosine-specific restriction endonuclease McrA
MVRQKKEHNMEEKKTWQSEYRRILQEDDEWYAKQEEQALQAVKKAAFKPWQERLFIWAAAFVTAFAYMVNIVVASIGPQVLPNDWIPNTWLVATCHSWVVVFILSLAAVVVLDLMKTSKISARSPLASLPVGFILSFIGIVICCYFATIYNGTFVQLLFQLFFAFVSYTLLDKSTLRKWEKERDEHDRDIRAQLDAIKDLPDGEPEPLEPQKQHCTLCLKESIYEVCLACEKRFQPERRRVRAQILRAKQHGVPATLTLREWLETLAVFHWRCAYCNGSYEVMEHYIPVTRGGGTTSENCVPACLRCNGQKADKDPEDIEPTKKFIKTVTRGKRKNPPTKKEK